MQRKEERKIDKNKREKEELSIQSIKTWEKEKKEVIR